MANSRVQIRPAAPPAERRWSVTMTTPATPVAAERDWTTELHELARRHAGCRFVGANAVAEAGASHGAVRVLIVDDSAPFRRAARELLRWRGYLVVGEAGTAAAARAAVERETPEA